MPTPRQAMSSVTRTVVATAVRRGMTRRCPHCGKGLSVFLWFNPWARLQRDSASDPSMNKGATLDADASRLAALLIAYRRPVCALLAPCHAGASTPGTFIRGRVLTAAHPDLALPQPFTLL